MNYQVIAQSFIACNYTDKLAQFEKSVQGFLKIGYTLVGGVSVVVNAGEGTIFQAVYRA